MTILYLLPLVDFFIGFLISYVMARFIVSTAKRRLHNYLADTGNNPLVQKQIREMIQKSALEEEIEWFLEKQVDDFVVLIKRQIPMAGSFLQGSLLERLKGMAREEIGKMLPPLKERVEQKVIASFRTVRWADFSLFQNSFDKEVIFTALLGGGLGFLLGALNILCIIGFSK
jgi:hypothetical protein